MRKIEHLLAKRTDIAKSADYNETTTCEAISPMMAIDRPTQNSRREGREAPLRGRACLRKTVYQWGIMGGSHRHNRDRRGRRRFLLLVLGGRLYEIALCAAAAQRVPTVELRLAIWSSSRIREGGIGASHSIAKYENGNGLTEKSSLITTLTFMQLQGSNKSCL